MQVSIIIPIYKSIPDWSELISFNQTIKILFSHPICIITHKKLDISYYIELLKQKEVTFAVEFFGKMYFQSLKGYNQLLLSKDFYFRFLSYEYILICQLDTYVFRDELTYWCNEGYDYIGAPWFNKFKSHEDGNELWKVGNGGFSLRKTNTFIEILNSNKNAYSMKRTYKINKFKKGSFIKFVRMALSSYENNISYLIQNWTDAEDIFFCLVLDDTRFKLDTPDVEVAKYFAFEQSPQFLFEQCNGILPFGCHAWSRYQYEIFWTQYIK